MLEGELGDPRISFGYVTEVVLAPGGKSAHVYVQVEGGDAAEADTLAGLEAAKGFIRHELLERMGVRHVPELMFEIDHSGTASTRIDELLGRAERRTRRNA